MIRIRRVPAAEFPVWMRSGRQDGVRLTADEAEELATRKLAGWSNQSLMLAYGLPLRTVQRYAKVRSVHTVRVGGWVGTFIVTKGSTPSLRGVWRRAVDDERDPAS